MFWGFQHIYAGPVGTSVCAGRNVVNFNLARRPRPTLAPTQTLTLIQTLKVDPNLNLNPSPSPIPNPRPNPDPLWGSKSAGRFTRFSV